MARCRRRLVPCIRNDERVKLQFTSARYGGTWVDRQVYHEPSSGAAEKQTTKELSGARDDATAKSAQAFSLFAFFSTRCTPTHSLP